MPTPNSLGFPAIFRGTLDVRARTISDEMALAAARELARFAEERGLREDYIVPGMDDWEVFPREAAATAMKAQEQGLARIKLGPDQLHQTAAQKIQNAREATHLMMREGIIPPPPDSN
jgi:malate dehydrogenase (oxaloacetate-decarboxylating)